MYAIKQLKDFLNTEKWNWKTYLTSSSVFNSSWRFLTSSALFCKSLSCSSIAAFSWRRLASWTSSSATFFCSHALWLRTSFSCFSKLALSSSFVTCCCTFPSISGVYFFGFETALWKSSWLVSVTASEINFKSRFREIKEDKKSFWF